MKGGLSIGGIELLLGAAALIAIYEFLTKAGTAAAGAVNSAAGAVAAPIANAYVSATSGPVLIPNGSAVFADGSYVSMGDISPTWVGNTLEFSYKGTTYALSSHDANGNYPATPIYAGSAYLPSIFTPAGP